MTNKDSPRHYETIQQAAGRLEVSTRTVRRWIATGQLTAYRVGRTIRLRPGDVDRVLTPTDAWAGKAQ